MRKIWILNFLLTLFILLSSGISCSENDAASGVSTNSNTPKSANPSVLPQSVTSAISTIIIPDIDVGDAYRLIQNNKNNPDFIILDVRTADEFNSEHLSDAINIDYYASDFKDKVSQLDRSKEYLVYCRTGIRSTASVQIMLDLGFTKIHNLSGGIVQWINAGYPTVN